VTEPDPTIVVFRDATHGLPAREYAAELRDRLPDCEVRLARTPHQERDYAADAEIATGADIDREVLAASDRLRWFACSWAGTEHLPLEALFERDVAVTNASGIHAPNIAETVLGHMLVFARRLHEGWRRDRNREWRHFQGRELKGSTVTVVGMGAIGRATLERLAAFDVDTVGVRYTPGKGGPADEVIGFDDAAVHEALARTEYLVIASPLTETTRYLVDAEALATLPPEAVLVNVGRGGIVDTDALTRAIENQAIRGAALDVVDPEPLPGDHPLWRFENVVITPHNAGHSPEHWARLADVVAENVERIRDTGTYEGLRNQVQTR
jgi:phosphoglycerate dehydrogenase-like enzyme